ncbi:MAG: hypothetical protein N2482_01320 [Patescibacteria group bacterium]|nr:hypothetical protein [Patescibacteria group bacterium]
MVIFLLTVLSIFYFFDKLKKYQKKFFIFNLLIIFFIFTFSLFYKDNFWHNYLEGFSLFYLLLISISLSLIYKNGNLPIKFLATISFLIILVLNLNKFFTEIKDKDFKIDGLAKQKKVIQTLYQENKYKDFCLRIYTPPVIPYTYQYLIDYYSRTKKYPKPKSDYVNNQCWYVIEDDQYKFRIKNWRKENIPNNTIKIKNVKIFKDISIELWSL